MGKAIHWGGNFSWLPFAWQTECRRTRRFDDLCGGYCCLTKFLMFPEAAILPTDISDRSSSCMEPPTKVCAPLFLPLKSSDLTPWEIFSRSLSQRKTLMALEDSLWMTVQLFSASLQVRPAAGAAAAWIMIIFAR
ncbi:conserved hypothetical protein [Neospora caninum Liverpool]|uniref:Uncharacterized protein n=1 Tax=Neospora caninum (strain Liverpool) TaxID=572307 RepID=F0VDP3_NEOCL|nr:conserved hypothetical protein [Neospora caninum Liverpool]CBZ51836.1 conserved hypothetical protein [Neospora caninum Liverpool]CEL65794.1 TPA: hypothetical protein BN1204_016280 [Neospora caninum Liverpool]|eukprot:XP_003881869.1 conserved hypothetical protein [Neospora caninum Liverpool]